MTAIVVPQRTGPLDNLFVNLILGKIQHNYQMDLEDRRLKAKELEQKQQGQNALKVAGWQEVPQSAQMQMQKSGTAPSDVQNVYGSYFRRPETTVQEAGNYLVLKGPGGVKQIIQKKDSQKGGFVTLGDKSYSYTIGSNGQPLLNPTPVGPASVGTATPYKDFVSAYKEAHPGTTKTDVAMAWKQNQEDIQAATGFARGKGYAYARQVQVWDRKANDFVQTNQGLVDEMNIKEPGRYIPASQAKIMIPGVMERTANLDLQRALAKVPTGSRATAVTTASEVYDKETPEIVSLRYKVEKEGALPASRFKDINQFNQWLSEKSSNPDVALLRKKVKLLSESLQRSMGSTQGGEWAFSVAQDILDPSFSGKAFENIVKSHGTMLRETANSYRFFRQDYNKLGQPSTNNQNNKQSRFQIIEVK